MSSPDSEDDRLRLLVYTTQIRYGGGYENLALSLATQLHELGESVFLLTHYSDLCVTAHHACPPRSVPAGLPTGSLEVPVAPSLIACVKAAIRLRKLIRDRGINSVEVSGDGPSVLACLATVGLGTTVLVGVHDVIDRHSQRALRRLLWFFIGRMCRHVRFYGVSRTATSAWIQFCRARPARVATVFNSIDDAYFDAHASGSRGRLRQELGCAEDDRIILCVGRLMRRKAQDVVLDALEPLLQLYRLRLVFVGRSDTEPGDSGATIAAVRARVDSGELKRYVHFLGQRHDIPQLLADADLLVHVPRKEAFGLVLAEAMASGVPVIASNVDGIPEVVEGTDTLLVPAGDSLPLRDAIERYLNWPPARRAHCIQQGLVRAQSFRDLARTSSIITLFRNAIKGRRAI